MYTQSTHSKFLFSHQFCDVSTSVNHLFVIYIRAQRKSTERQIHFTVGCVPRSQRYTPIHIGQPFPPSFSVFVFYYLLYMCLQKNEGGRGVFLIAETLV